MKLLITTSKKPSLKQGFFFSLYVLLGTAWIFLLDFLHYKCPWLTFFHVFCPGCGGTRMVLSLLHLDFYQAFRYNPFLFILLIAGFFYLFFMAIYYQKKRVFILPSIQSWIILIVLLLVYAVMRNMDAFIYLIPTEV